ncbi:MAG: helix-turn-helix domain-containing protein [Patescibacteria group bacterium]|nr:helix-turn-helix domain-containing protein [Patescibacteria group bacterium]
MARAKLPTTHEIVKAAGGPVKLAAALGIHYSTISGWKQIPAHHVLRVAQLSGVPLEHVLATAAAPGAHAS